MAMPASGHNKAARGVWRRSQSVQNAPAVCTMPLTKQANTPRCQASCESCVRR